MELRDLIVTPCYIFFVYFALYLARPYLCDQNNHRYYFPALTLKIIGALAVGFIYQFYYHGGDTYNYHTFGSRVVWEAFMNDPIDGLNLFLNSSKPDLYPYTARIPFYYDPSSFFVIRVAWVLDLLTASSY